MTFLQDAMALQATGEIIRTDGWGAIFAQQFR